MTKEILIIDDNLDIRQLVSGILVDKGFRVREAANFDQALLEINKKVLLISKNEVIFSKIFIHRTEHLNNYFFTYFHYT